MQYINNALMRCGVPASLIGFQYLHDAVEMVMYDPDAMRRVTKTLYPEIAKKSNTTASRVERGIRHAVDTSMLRISADMQSLIFGNTIDPKKGKPTNGEFIAAVALYVGEAIK